MKANARNFSFFLILLILINSCDFLTVTPLEPTKTISFEETDDGYIHYSTNDISKYMGDDKYLVPSINLNPFKEIVVELKKDSGYAYGDFGIIFAFKDIDNYYLLNIDTKQKFTIKEMDKGILSTKISWTENTSLNSGYGVINTIKIKRNSPNYEIYFNSDINSINFNDSTFTEGGVGYFVYIGSIEFENFPSQPVDVSFKLISSISGF